MSQPRRARGGREANDAGALWEYRLARLRFMQGFFVRRSIYVWPDGLGLQSNNLAELDVLSTSFDARLRRRTEIIEAKSGTGAKEVERVMWMRGMAAYTGVDEATFAKVRVDPRVRPVARRVRVNILDEAAVAAAEKALGIGDMEWIGFADPDLGERVVKPAREHLTSSDPLRRAGRFLFGTFWFTDEFTRIKQLRTLADLLHENHSDVDPTALVLACSEVVTLTALSTLEVTNWRGQYEPAEFQEFATGQFSSGLGQPDGLRRLLAQVDAMTHDFVEGLHDEYTAATGAARISRRIPQLQHELLRVPEWAEAFMDLSSRMQERADLAMHILQLLDLRAAGRLGSTRNGGKAGTRWAGADQQVIDAANLVERFCVSVWGLPERGLQPVSGKLA
ncbi:hypothetical protein ACFPIJ_54040 [Dactylosporangium cerinum]|uniref:Uncharacterized protein n=1 Tax=Dactylosporangium cerinum TaxID=1434730 RepID=A0ABV9WDB1_9ACTN